MPSQKIRKKATEADFELWLLMVPTFTPDGARGIDGWRDSDQHDRRFPLTGG